MLTAFQGGLILALLFFVLVPGMVRVVIRLAIWCLPYGLVRGVQLLLLLRQGMIHQAELEAATDQETIAPLRDAGRGSR